MEACVFTTNSLTKNIKFSTSTISRPKILTHFKKNNSLSHHRKVRVGSPTSISCCSRDQYQPSDEENSVNINFDWRSFRARLVASEASNQLPSIGAGQKWAHAIHEPEKGCLLIATEKLDGVHIFERAVVLLLSTGPLGPSGIILNRPSLMSIKETKSTTMDYAGTFSDRPLFFGGPLQEGLFLVGPRWAEGCDEVSRSGGFEEVMKGLYYGTRESVGCASEMVKRSVVGIDDFRFFDGYCGWEKEQLKGEIRAGYWTLAACSPTVIGLGSVGSIGLWDEVLGLVGQRRVW